jgi:hypothetical protein
MGMYEIQDFKAPTEGFLTYPKNKVIALLDDTGSVRCALTDLVRAGFDKEGIDVLSGPEGAARLDVDGRQHGFKARIYRLVERVSDTSEWLQRHADHIAQGGFGVTVPADKTRKTQAAEILGRHGAHDRAYFGKAHWETID